MIPAKKLHFNDGSLPLWSVLIPSWNNLSYLKLCVSSLRKYSSIPIQIIVHINEGSDGTLEWCRNEGIEFSYSSENIGICYGVNSAASLAKGEYIVFMNDDMYVLPGWDIALWNQIKKIGHTHFFLSGTLIEPMATGNKSVISPANFGVCEDTFDEVGLLKHFKEYKKGNWYGATWPPNIVHVSLWEAVGGYSVEFSPGMYSDPDFSMKLWHAGVRIFAGIAESRVYHFMSKSTFRLRTKNNGQYMFLRKWGLSNKQFRHNVIFTGNDLKGEIQPLKEVNFSTLKRGGQFKKLWYSLLMWF